MFNRNCTFVRENARALRTTFDAHLYHIQWAQAHIDCHNICYLKLFCFVSVIVLPVSLSDKLFIRLDSEDYHFLYHLSLSLSISHTHDVFHHIHENLSDYELHCLVGNISI